MADQTEKPKLGTRPPLGLKRTVETGKVKQSFSHGRSNTVVVEVKKRRILGRPGEAPPAEAPKPEPVAEAPDAARRSPPLRAAPQAVAPQDDIDRRKELQEKLLREAEEARLRFARGSAPPRRARQGRADRGRAPPRRRESQGRRSCRRRGAARSAEEEARRAAEAPAEPEAAAPAERREKSAASAAPAATRPRPSAPEPARPSRGRGDDQRHRGKLTVTPRALRRGRQPRPLARRAPPRPRKGKAPPQETGPAQKQVRDVVVPEAITVQELANRMAERGADLVKALFKMGMPVTLTQTIDQDTAELLVTEFGHRIKRVSEATSTSTRRPTSMPPKRFSRARRSSRSWAMSTTARPRCSTRSAARTWSPTRPAASPSISAPIRSACPTSRRSPSSTRRATKPSRRCARAAPTSPTSSILVVAADDGLTPADDRGDQPHQGGRRADDRRDQQDR